MRTVLRTIAALSGGLAVFLAAAPFAVAQSTGHPPPKGPRITLEPSSGPPGSGFVIRWSGFPDGKFPCITSMRFTWDGAQLKSIPEPQSSGQTDVQVPSAAKLGPHTVAASCQDPTGFAWTARAPFTVTAPPTSNPPTTTTPPIITPPPPVTPPPAPSSSSPSRRRPSSSSRPPVTTTTPPGTSVPPPTSTELPPLSTADPRPRADGDLVLDRKAIKPGDPLSASGKGCDPKAPVTLMSKGERIGGTVADENGNFTAPVQFQRVEPGRHWVTTNCGVVLTAAVDQLVTSSSSGQTSTMIILVFFVLAGVALIRFS